MFDGIVPAGQPRLRRLCQVGRKNLFRPGFGELPLLTLLYRLGQEQQESLQVGLGMVSLDELRYVGYTAGAAEFG